MGTEPVITITAVPNKRVDVGINYPWAWDKFGVFFGSGNKYPSEDPRLDIWTTNLARNLDILKSSMGVKVVRIFLFCNANNFGSFRYLYRPKPIPLPPPGPLPEPPADVSNQEFLLPSTLHPTYVRQLKEMLQAFAERGMKVIPSLLSFEALARWDYPAPDSQSKSAGRGDLVVDPVKRDRFFDMVLEPFLAASQPYADAILAWEVVNEPGQVVDTYENTFRSIFGTVRTQYPVTMSQMSEFLQKAIDRIKAAGFQSTVGHWYVDNLGTLPTGSMPQFHYYPSVVFGYRAVYELPEFRTTGAFIGEFAAERRPADQSSAIDWPELSGPDQEAGDIRTLKRLRLIEAKGYRLALLWPDMPGAYDDTDLSRDPVHFSRDVRNGIRLYLGI